jgi:hypothetical protein
MAAAGSVMAVVEVVMAHGMVLGTTGAQAQADMPAMVQTLMVAVVVVMPLLQAAVAVQVAGIQVHMAYQQAAV